MYVISVAAELAGVHPQTLRIYERKGLVQPQRTAGNTRRYSEQDIELLRKIQRLTNEGVNLAGVMRILQLEDELERLHERTEELALNLEEVTGVRAAMAIVPLRDVRRVRRVLKTDTIERAARKRAFPLPPVQ